MNAIDRFTAGITTRDQFDAEVIQSERDETMEAIDAFTRAYIEAALWSSQDENGETLDGLYSADDIHPDTLALMVADCQDFQTSFGQFVADDESRAGHDFWLTRNGHGAGFWDGDWEQPMAPDGKVVQQYRTVGQYLTAMSKPYGSFDLYVGDDGMIHGS